MSDNKTLTTIPHFDGHYDHWSDLMENLLRAKDLWILVEKGFNEPKPGAQLTESQHKQLAEARINDHKYECPELNKEAHYAEIEEEDELLLTAYVDLHETKRIDVWFIESGSSNHMCANQGMFTSLDTTFCHTFKLGNNTSMIVVGKGVIKLKLKEIYYVIGDVYYVPDLKNILSSVGQLQEKGLTVIFKDVTCNITYP
ncbi:uncharacterized protein [Primulina eburnea]|uniref:uncharacterized protein n=1 Tax=Primulina eburnea TaxID=1245227 RepID=UPI003C6C9C37